jgi:TPR repeat protein
MGLCYLQGHGVPMDSIRGLSLLESAASLGVAVAHDKIQGRQDT